jgi:hypothetical protein
MRLDPAEVPELPLAAALFGRDGEQLAVTPEWQGAGPGSAVYQLGQAHLVVAPEVPTPELDALVSRLLQTLEAASAEVPGEEAMRIEVLAAGLELVAGRPPRPQLDASARRVMELAVAAISARSQGLSVRLQEPVQPLAVPFPGAMALALTQLAVNAQQHEGARNLVLRAVPGPTFYVEWPDAPRGAVRVASHRHHLRRTRWGWGYVQMVADALGATALPPGPTGAGMVGASLSLGHLQLTLPLALVRGGRVERSTLAWDQDPRAPGIGQEPAGTLAELLVAASRLPGRIAYLDLYRARSSRQQTWLALAPEAGSSRVRDLVSGLAHERALWSAPEPLATRLQGLTSLLGVALGEPWPSVPPAVWEASAPAAASALGVSLPASLTSLVLPDPRLVAVLLAELDGRLVEESGRLYVQPSPARAGSPWLSTLGTADSRGLHVNP